MSRAALRTRAALPGMLGLLAAALVGLQLSGAEPGLLYAAPALLLLGLLVLGHYPGERLLDAVTRRRNQVRAFRRVAPARPPGPPRSFPRGGVLLALALAGRGPPG